MVAMRTGLRSRPAALGDLPEAGELFAENAGRVRAVTGLPTRVGATHGDFVHRRLAIPDRVLRGDSEFPQRLDVDLETYNEAFVRCLLSRHTDAPYQRCWGRTTGPSEAVGAGEPVISVVVHPRPWRVDWIVNTPDDIQRVVEGLRLAVSGGRRRWV